MSIHTKGARLSLVDSSSNPVAFSQAYGDGVQLNAGAVELTEVVDRAAAFGAVNLAPGTYTLTAEYGSSATVKHPSLSIVDGFDLQLTWAVARENMDTLDEINTLIDAGINANAQYYVGPDYNPMSHPIDDVAVINYGAGASSHFDSDASFPRHRG